MYDFIFISYVELCAIPTFQKSMYLDSLTLMNFSLSNDLDTSLPQTGWYGARLGILVGNFGDPFGLAFHNLISGISIRFQTKSVGKILYNIIDHLEESTENVNRCILVCLNKISTLSFKQPMTQDLKSKIS
jgi:hypothetical protein